MSAAQQQLQLAMTKLLTMANACFGEHARMYEAKQAGGHEHLNIIQHTVVARLPA